MTSRRIVSVLVASLALTLFACRANDSTSPLTGASAHRIGRRSTEEHIPGAERPAGSFESNGSGQLLACSRREQRFGMAIIGPSGGTLTIGRDRLIVPAGALLAPTFITATIPADTIASIHFEPEGLQFKKPAGLVLDAEGCSALSEHPSILYLDDDGNILERIDATFSNWWHTVAAPINHFSVYAIGV